MRRECVVEDLVGDLPAERLQRRRGPGAFHAVPGGEPCVVRPGTLVVPIGIRAVLPRTVDGAGREFRVVRLAAHMPGFMAERRRPFRHGLVVEVTQVQLDGATALAGVGGPVATLGAQIVDALAHESTAPLKNILRCIPGIVEIILRGVGERITAVECPCEWEVRVTGVVPAPPVLPVRLVAVEPIRGPKIVDHVLAADVLAILVVSAGILVWNRG